MVKKCVICGEPLERVINLGNGEVRLPVACKCTQQIVNAEREKAEKAEQRMRELDYIRENYASAEYAGYTFDVDDKPDGKDSQVMRRYVEKWPEIKAKNIGLLLSGKCGTGKTFYACAVANAVRSRYGEKVMVYSLPKLIAVMGRNFGTDAETWERRLETYGLVVLDDLGVERDTEYQNEKVQEIIDIRTRANKPLIVTTNISVAEFKDAKDITRERMYSRIIGACTPYTMTGADRRIEKARAKLKESREVLGI